MNRSSLILSVASLGAIASPTFAKTQQPQKPNILFILADDYGWKDMSCSGSKYYETPNLDRLAAEGVRFTRAYSNCSVCSPSRASILTGQYPPRHDITNFIGAPSGEEWRKQIVFPSYYLLIMPIICRQIQSQLPGCFARMGIKRSLQGSGTWGVKVPTPKIMVLILTKVGMRQAVRQRDIFRPITTPNLPTDLPGRISPFVLPGKRQVL